MLQKTREQIIAYAYLFFDTVQNNLMIMFHKNYEIIQFARPSVRTRSFIAVSDFSESETALKL